MLLWKIAMVGQLTYAQAWPDPGTTAGRLVAAGVFVIAGLPAAGGRPHWRRAAVVGCMVSIPVLLAAVGTAAAGFALDVVILAVALAGDRIRFPLNHWSRA